MSFTTVSLSSGATIEVQTTNPLLKRGPVTEASPLDKLSMDDLKEAMERAGVLANEALGTLREKLPPCKEASVEFGISLGGKTGVILVEGTVNANFKLTIKW